MRRLSTQVQDSVGDVTSVAEEGIENYKVVRIFRGQQQELAKFFKATKRNLQQSLKVVVTNSIGSASVQILVSIPIAGTLFFATMPSFNFSAGGFAAIVGAMVSLLRPFRRLTTVNATFQKGIAGTESIYQMLSQPVEDDCGKQLLSNCQGELHLKDISFRYAEDSNWVLHNISLQVPHGKTIALVGRSGSGKTTLVNLLPRFYESNKGSICIDGHDIKQFTLDSLRQQFSIVSQNTTLFNETIANNIAYGMDNVDLEQIRQAAKAACADEFIERFPMQYDELIGEDGVLLSGGQRQRIAIARALLKKAPILILDEATSALDSHSEQHIQRALTSLMAFSTSIVIAHRLSTIENADWIVVMDQGHIIEQGTHADLLAKQGAYVELRKVQFREEEAVETV